MSCILLLLVFARNAVSGPLLLLKKKKANPIEIEGGTRDGTRTVSDGELFLRQPLSIVDHPRAPGAARTPPARARLGKPLIPWRVRRAMRHLTKASGRPGRRHEKGRVAARDTATIGDLALNHPLLNGSKEIGIERDTRLSTVLSFPLDLILYNRFLEGLSTFETYRPTSRSHTSLHNLSMRPVMCFPYVLNSHRCRRRPGSQRSSSFLIHLCIRQRTSLIGVIQPYTFL